MIRARHGASDALQFAVAASVLLFWWQALRVIFAVMFGIVYDQTRSGPVGPWLFISGALVLASLVAPAALAPAATSVRSRGRSLALFAGAVALGRLVVSLGGPGAQFLGSLIVISAGTAYLAALVQVDRRLALPGLLAALVLDQCLRVAGDTYDLSLRSGWLPVQAAWSLALVVAAARFGSRADAQGDATEPLGLAAGIALGGALFLEVSLLSLPSAVSRWSDQSYSVIAPALTGITVLPLFPAFRRRISDGLSLAVVVRLAIAGSLGVMVVGGYFAGGPVSAAALLAAHATALAVLVCVFDGSPRQPAQSPAAGLTLGLLLLVALGVLSTFAFTYAYTIPPMRGLGWAVYLSAALLTGTALLSQRPPAADLGPSPLRPALICACGALAVAVSMWAAWPQALRPMPNAGTLRIATYNIHYGYDGSWDLRLDDIARTIEESEVDVIALQEVDAGRLTSYGVDDAYYLARRLRMNVAFLPTAEHLTGIALLYHGPPEETASRLLTSRKEQTGIVYARLSLGAGPLHAFGTWIGLSDENTMAQIGESLEFIGGRKPAIYAGDFNARPGSEVVRAIEAAGFVDPFAALGIDPAPLTAPAVRPTKRIDYVWIRGLVPVDAWVPDSTASDHRMVVVEVQLPR